MIWDWTTNELLALVTKIKWIIIDNLIRKRPNHTKYSSCENNIHKLSSNDNHLLEPAASDQQQRGSLVNEQYEIYCCGWIFSSKSVGKEKRALLYLNLRLSVWKLDKKIEMVMPTSAIYIFIYGLIIFNFKI